MEFRKINKLFGYGINASGVDPRKAPPMPKSVKIKLVALRYCIIIIVNNVPYDSYYGVFIGPDSVLSKAGPCRHWLDILLSSSDTYL